MRSADRKLQKSWEKTYLSFSWVLFSVLPKVLTTACQCGQAQQYQRLSPEGQVRKYPFASAVALSTSTLSVIYQSEPPNQDFYFDTFAINALVLLFRRGFSCWMQSWTSLRCHGDGYFLVLLEREGCLSLFEPSTFRQMSPPQPLDLH